MNLTMKIFLSITFLLISILGVPQNDKVHVLDINYKPLGDYFFPIESIELMNSDTVIKAESINRLTNIPTGDYKLRFLSDYGDIYDTTVIFLRRTKETITPLGLTRFYKFDSLETNTTIIKRLDNSDTLNLEYFLSEDPIDSRDKAIIVRQNDNLYFLTDNDNSVDLTRILLTESDIKKFMLWEFYAKMYDKSGEYNCFSLTRNYTMILDHKVYKLTDKSCSEYDWNYLMNILNKNAP
jgi:hypothetical protein